MGSRAEAIARTFLAKVDEATAAEQWPVGVTAHHIAVAHEIIAGIVKTLAGGKPGPSLPLEALNQMNAKHAQDHAGCTKAETLALHTKAAAAAAALVRGLSDRELDRSGVVLQGQPAMTVEQLAGGLLTGHIDEHLASIRATVGA